MPKPFLFGAFLFNILFSYAQTTSPKFEHITIADGLSQSSVFSILEDAEGFMWFGTRAGGLNKYDGYTFTIFNSNSNDSVSISGNEIISLLDDNEGNIWAGTRSNGLNRYNKSKNIFYNYYYNEADSTSLLNNDVNSLFKDKYGVIWVGTNSGLCFYNKEQDNFVRYQSSGIEYGSIKVIAKTNSDSLVWLGAKAGLYLFDVKNKKEIKHFVHKEHNPNSLSSNNVTAIAEDKSGHLWVGTYKNGLNFLANPNDGIFKHHKHEANNINSITSNVVRTLHIDKKGIIWIGTKIALEQLMPKQQMLNNPVFIHHKKDESDDRSMNQNSVFSFLEDRHGNFWIGSYNGGVNYLYTGEQKFEYYKHQIYSPSSISNNVVSSFAITEQGIWVGTEGGGLNLFNRKTGKFKHFRQDLFNPDGLKSNHIKSLFVDSKQNLWIGTYNGLFLYNKDKNTFTHYLKGWNIYTISEGLANELWVGSTRKLFVFNTINKSIKTYESIKEDTNSISNIAINKVFKDKYGDMWIGTKEGLNLYDRLNDHFICFYHDRNDKTSLSNSHITAISEDINGDLWVATFDGLNKFNREDKTFKHFGENINILGKVINNLQFDNEGYCWITTNNVLTKFHTDSTKSKSLVNTTIRSYDSHDGLQEGEFRLNGSYKSKSGELFFGGVNGFNIFNPNKVKNNLSIPEVIITKLKLFNAKVLVNGENSPLKKPVWQTKEITLDYWQSVFTFEFVSLNYVSPENNEYAYMMDGFEKEWNYIGNKREATYTSLPAGKYLFRVKASNNDGVWNEEGTSIELVILPPWWKTWWFRIGLTLSVLLLAFAYYLYRIGILKEQKRLLEEMVDERTNELSETNTQLEESHEEILVQKDRITERNTQLITQKGELEKAYNNIEMLSDIGKEITMKLSVEEIINLVYKSVQAIMEATVFSIGLFDEANNRLQFKGVVSSGNILPDFYYDLNDNNRMSTWCFNNQKELIVNDLNVEYKKYVHELAKPKEGDLPNSIIYIPLKIEDKKIGVISVNSPNKNAYTSYHLNILRNIGIYASIAFDNAEAYDKIEKQTYELVESNLKLQKQQFEIKHQNEELLASEEEMSQLNEELSVTNEQLHFQKNELQIAINELKETQSRLLHSEKMASIGVLASGVSHEINNPLNYIKGGSTILKTYITENLAGHSAQLDPIIDMIQTGVSRATGIVSGLNRFSRKTKSSNELCDIHSIIDNCLLMVRNQTEFKIDIEKNYTPDKFAVKGNEGELHQLIINILNNAEQAIVNKGSITITTVITKGKGTINITDTGEGISEINIKKITEPFFTTKDPGKGTGLGMSIAYSILEKHKGSINYQSELGKGTTVSIILPIEHA